MSHITKIANNSVLGNNSGSTAIASELTAAQLTAIANTFTTSLQGVVPASGGGTSNFLRADGSWAAPAAGVTSVSGTSNQITVSPTTGAAVVSLPSTVILPGTLVLGGTVTGGGFDLGSTGNVYPNTAGAFSLGSSTRAWQNLYLTNIGNTTNYAVFTPQALTGNRTINIPDANSTTVQGATAGANQFLTAISSTTGALTFTQPSFSNLTGQAALTQLPTIANNTVLGNNTGGSATPIALTATQLAKLLATARFTSSNQSITAGGSLTVAHGLGVVPGRVWFRLKCTTANLNYAVGDLVEGFTCVTGTQNNGSPSISIWADASNINVRFNTSSPVFQILNKTTGSFASATNASWAVVLYAEI